MWALSLAGDLPHGQVARGWLDRAHARRAVTNFKPLMGIALPLIFCGIWLTKGKAFMVGSQTRKTRPEFILSRHRCVNLHAGGGVDEHAYDD